MVASRRVLPPVVPFCATCSGAAAPFTGAVAGTGGWLLVAPGTPDASALPAPSASVVCSLRTVAAAGFPSAPVPWLGV